MSIHRLLSDYNIPYSTSGKHSSTGWVNIHCPFCAGGKDYHLGINENLQGCHCWRCGGHSLVKVIAACLNKTPSQAITLLNQYRGKVMRKEAPEAKVAINPFKFPTGTGQIGKVGECYYADYLKGRGFDPEYLIRQWNLLRSGPVSGLDGISYSHRIIIPIRWNNEVVSFQGRDITGDSDLKYLTCPMKREKIHHKEILYCDEDEVGLGRATIIVEGVVDVWRLGKSAAATFGIKFKMEQVLRLAEMNDRFFIVFDDDRDAQKQARLLRTKLMGLGKEVYIERLKGKDPGDLTEDEAGHLVKCLGV